MKLPKKQKQFMFHLIDPVKRRKLEQIIEALEKQGTPNTPDIYGVDKPKHYTDIVRVGVYGETLTKWKEYLEATE